jgi:hypothetical protein
MKAAFTICANNYLAQAKVLKESFNKYHPDIPFLIVLTDKKSNSINYNDYYPGDILFVDDIVDINVDELSLKFNISELSTTVKPFVFKYFFNSYNQVVYLDPDIKVYSHLTECWQALSNYTFVLTPHLMNPVDDGKKPSDLDTLRTGMFNLGFIGLAKGNELDKFLSWWGDRLLAYGFTAWDKGMFYDQIWANYIPVMFNNFYILKHYGYNVANWNWHERVLTYTNYEWKVNETWPLVFFHFSSYKYLKPELLCVYNTRYSRENRIDLVPIFDEYYSDLKKAGIEITLKIPAVYQDQYMEQIMKSDAERPLIKKIKRKLIRYIENKM